MTWRSFTSSKKSFLSTPLCLDRYFLSANALQLDRRRRLWVFTRDKCITGINNIAAVVRQSLSNNFPQCYARFYFALKASFDIA